MKILYLYSELVGYQIPIFLEYVNKYNAEVHVVSWDKNNLKPYVPPVHDDITYYKRSGFDNKKLLKLVDEINPDIVYISGWMDKGYLKAAKRLRRLNIPVVSAFDDVWEGRLRQKIGALVFPFTYKKCFSHAWVAGPYQYEFAARIGFKKDEIIFDMLSADLSLFKQEPKFLDAKKLQFPKAFLYVGNFRLTKGTDILIEAFKKYRSKYNGDWKLICVGNGKRSYLFNDVANVELIGFSKQETLIEIVKRAGAFVLPSRHEQWGLVVHEFAAVGMPLILSDKVGSRPTFLIENFNGISFHNDSPELLAKAMHIMSQKSTAELCAMSQNSMKLSKRITPEISAASFISVLKQER